MWTKYTPGRSRKSHYKSIVVLYQMNSKADHVSSLSETPTPKPVRAWLEDLNLKEVYISEVERKSFQVNCGDVSGNRNPDHKTAVPETARPKTVRAWLEDLNMDEVYTSEVERKALQVDCGVVSGNSNPDINSGLSATPGPKTVRAWLKDVNLYKAITLLYFPFSNLISWRN